MKMMHTRQLEGTHFFPFENKLVKIDTDVEILSAYSDQKLFIESRHEKKYKRTYSQPSEQLFPKRWPLSNRNRTKNEKTCFLHIYENKGVDQPRC